MPKKTTNMISTISLFLLISSTALYASGHPISPEGYGGTRWGMSKVIVNCILPDNKKENDDFLTINESQFAGIRSKTTLHFVYDMLFKIVIFFDMKLSSIQKGSLENYLFEKYGIAELLNDGGKNIEIQWERSDTLINYIHYRETDSTIITFKSKTIDKALNAPQGTPLDFLNGGKVIK